MHRHVRLSSAFLLFTGLLSTTLQAQEPVEFNPAFFGGRNGKAVDLSRFQGGNALTPGVHQLDLYLNGNHVGRQQVRVRVGDTASPTTATPATTAARADAQPCLPMKVYERIGVNTPLLNAEQAVPVSDDQCVGLDGLPPSSRFDVDMSELRANLSIPQIYIKSTARGYVPPDEWDAGINAGFLGYAINLSSNRYAKQDNRQFYSSVNTGVNLGAWRLRHSGSFSHTSKAGASGGSHYQALSSYVQRDATPFSAQLTLGQFYTPGNIFDSIPYTGIQLSSDERMLPDSMRGFAPVVRGVADTTAKVSVRQGNNLLYETTVSPGPFAIDDLYNTGYAGDLDVTITEADGRTKRFVVPYASVAQLLRPGSSRFSLTGGRYRDDTLNAPPAFLQGTYQRGLSDTVTGYGGIIAAQQYRALQGGLALSTPLGALAADLTQSRATHVRDAGQQEGGAASGRSLRLSYSKLLEPTSTNFSVVGYRFSSEGYLSLGEFARRSGRTSAGGPGSESYRSWAYGDKERSRLQFNISQPLGEAWGQVALSGVAQNYWGRDRRRDTSFYAGYSNGFRWGSLSISVTRTRDDIGRFGNQYLLSLSVPLGRGSNSPTLRTSLSAQGKDERSVNASLSGSAGDSGQFGYSLYGSQDRNDGQGSANQGGSLRYDTGHASYNLSGSRGNNYRQMGAGMRGMLVAHAGGINATQSQGETMAVLEAPSAEGAAIVSGSRGRIAGNGYGVVAGLMPYRRNDVALDPKGTSQDVELEMTSQQVAPRAGAVVLLRYPTVVGRPMLLKLVRERGASIPMGAELCIVGSDTVTLVGQGGRAFVRGLQGGEQLIAKWGEGSDQQCWASYQVNEQAGVGDTHYPQLELPCVAPSPRQWEVKHP
ncbi:MULTISPECIES: fimbria/pilus outer membrane usher protein [Achromobacter]|uniref:Fimbrial biogenesis outer membrane usher protein n=1 Tax=Achromobacter spanius TaxID=217203 RepID=A0ABY8GQH6_9BURK|nr:MULTISPECIES: fimbria/pilus outer membrane usher protein [Achromobacter]WAI83804.1 fimbrial biogenesis outer membrane usher protein [Achromobacter spanius]WEX93885.1 fimbrial biogenesis outer membrane usher protein [Achromobacter sp. SS2-2022]WFP06952.1 fimbrial biogenesis outer membrane usher protein [Achromobacter spanius]